MLLRYRYDDRIMMISGTNYLLNRLEIPESYCFSRYYAIWGWATWRRAWHNYDISMGQWQAQKKNKMVNSFYAEKFMRQHIISMFDLAYNNLIDTWDIQWFYSCLSHNAVSIVPKINLVSNIGLVGTHTSSDVSNNFMPIFELDLVNIKHPQEVLPNSNYDSIFFKERLKESPGLKFKKLLKRLKNCILFR